MTPRPGHVPDPPPDLTGQPPAPTSRLGADQIAELVDGYRSGKTMKEPASELGIHRTTVSSHLTQQGVPIRR